jgi:DNA processing protein
MKYSNAELCLIWLDSFVGLEYKHKLELYKKISGASGIKSLLENSKDYILSAIGEKEYTTLLSSAKAEYLNFILSGLEERKIKVLTIDSVGYPDKLKEVDCPPLVLYLKGDERLLDQERLFAIVGSRKSLPLAVSLAKDYTKQLSDAGFIPVTGIAEGVDSAVLTAALENGKKAISVIGGGFDNIYPASNVNLVDSVIENGGLIVAEYPPQTVPKPFHFPIRNRIIAALGEGVLIVSGGVKSGTQYTAEYAVSMSKEVFAIPYSVGVSSGAGCNELIKKGAVLTDSPKDILSYYGIEKESVTVDLSDEERDILRVLSDGEMHVEKLAQSLSRPTFALASTLSILEIKGMVIRSGNVYGVCRNDLEV